MKNLTTPIEVFIYIRDTKGFLEKEIFICNAIKSYSKQLKNIKLSKECKDLMEENKPFRDSFTQNEYFRNSLAWWCYCTAKNDNKLKELFKEKRRFLTHLIKTLNNENSQ
jgi:hypothetical protein